MNGRSSYLCEIRINLNGGGTVSDGLLVVLQSVVHVSSYAELK